MRAVCLALLCAAAPAAAGDFDYDVGINLGTPPNSPTAPDFQGFLTPDELQVFFVRMGNPTTEHYDILTSTRSSLGAAWSAPVRVGSSVDTAAAETSPVLSPDGLRLYFARWQTPNNPSGSTYDIMVAERATTGDPFGSPNRLDVSTMMADERDFALSADELTIVFSRRNAGGYDLFESTRASLTGNWTAPTALGGAVNTSDDERASYLTPDGRRLYFASDRSGDDDIYVAVRANAAEAWSTAAVALLGGGINTSGEESAAWVSPDGARLYFSAQDRTGAPAGNPDLMVSVSLDLGTDCEEVFACLDAEPDRLPTGPPGPPGAPGPPGPAIAGNAVLVQVASAAAEPPAPPAGYVFAGYTRLRGAPSTGRTRRVFAVYLRTSS
jgi:hypothetical protein